MKPLNSKHIAWYKSFIGTKDKWLKAWKQMKDSQVFMDWW